MREPLSLLFDGINHGTPTHLRRHQHQNKRRKTHKEKFIERFGTVVIWKRMMSVIEPYYPKLGNGKRPYPLVTMLSTQCIQQWCSMSGP